MAFLKGLFKRKPGGTFVGNLIRGVANKASGGLIGNGASMIKDTETKEEADTRFIKAVGSGIASFDSASQQSVNPGDTKQTVIEKLASGAKDEKKKSLFKFIGIGIAAIAAVVILIKTIFKRK